MDHFLMLHTRYLHIENTELLVYIHAQRYELSAYAFVMNTLTAAQRKISGIQTYTPLSR